VNKKAKTKKKKKIFFMDSLLYFPLKSFISQEKKLGCLIKYQFITSYENTIPAYKPQINRTGITYSFFHDKFLKPYAYLKLAIIYWQKENSDETKDYLQSILEKDPTNKIGLKIKRVIE